MENMNCEAPDPLTWYRELVLCALATNYSITWQRHVLLLKILDIGRICGQIVMCYLQLSYGT